MSTVTNVLITGCSRGIGRALFEAYLSRPAHVVVAAVRDPSSPASQALKGLPHGAGSRSLLVKIDSSSQSDALTAVEFLRSQHGIKRLDLVVANAGVSKYFGKAEETLVQEMLDHFTVNTVGPLLLFQATCSLLSESPRPKFVTISSGAGSIGMVEQLKVENTAYGASKAALNFVTRRIHYENPNIIAFCINPGWLQTDLGTHAARSSGIAEAPLAVEDGVRGILSVVDGATREETSGRFKTHDDKELPW